MARLAPAPAKIPTCCSSVVLSSFHFAVFRSEICTTTPRNPAARNTFSLFFPPLVLGPSRVWTGAGWATSAAPGGAQPSPEYFRTRWCISSSYIQILVCRVRMHYIAYVQSSAPTKVLVSPIETEPYCPSVHEKYI
ncbi:hypothetical protein LZ32DRAFT_609914 [Colletotrichum eremochloae]|nr:hypothetical protein LZ32DRAFT_609914 [Colletotrichum eremochloae]